MRSGVVTVIRSTGIYTPPQPTPFSRIPVSPRGNITNTRSARLPGENTRSFRTPLSCMGSDGREKGRRGVWGDGRWGDAETGRRGDGEKGEMREEEKVCGTYGGARGRTTFLRYAAAGRV